MPVPLETAVFQWIGYVMAPLIAPKRMMKETLLVPMVSLSKYQYF